MRILFITQWFQPEPHIRGLSFARELVKRGHQVQVLTGFPNYPGGKVYEGYRIRFVQKEMIDGVSIIRVPLYPSHDRSAVRRIANYASFALSAAVLGPWLVNRADVAYVYHPPATVGLPAMALRLFRGIPFVYDVEDMWPDTLRATGMMNQRTILSLIDRWCKWTYRVASRITVLSPGFKRLLAERGVPADKIEVLYNWAEDSQEDMYPYDQPLAEAVGMAGRFNVVFAGNMGKAQALESVLVAAQTLQDQIPQVQFVFIGGGVDVELLKRQAADLKLRNVLFLPRAPRHEIGKYLALADALLVHLRDDPLFEVTVPSKTQVSLAAGKPIIMAVRGDAADLVREAGAGVTCLPEDLPSLVRAVSDLYHTDSAKRAAMGENGRNFYVQHLAMHAGVECFEELFARVVGEQHSTGKSGVRMEE